MNNKIEECNPVLNCNSGKEKNCCSSKVICKKAECLDDISTECIFVEKVFDARITENSLEFAFLSEAPLVILNVEPTDLVSIETINVECNILSLETLIDSIRINDEFFDVSTTLPGPGGDQVVLNREQLKKVLDPNCAKEGKGTKVQMDILVRLSFDFEIVVTGTGIDSNGMLVPFIGSAQSAGIELGLTLSFQDFCIPPISIFPISLLTSCLMNCGFVLTKFEFLPDLDQINLIGGLFFCVTCETLLKIPSQLCALTTGPCKIKKSKSFCDDDDFPDDLTSLMSNRLMNVTSSMKKTKESKVESNKNIENHQLLGSFGTKQFNISPKT